MKKTIGRFVGWFVGLILLFTLLITAAYAIPDKAVDWHREFSEMVLNVEERDEYQRNLFGYGDWAHMMDIYSEKEMMKSTRYEREDMNPFQAAMSCNNYARYWHGYQVLLRPMLVCYHIWQIRYLYQFVFFGLLAWVLYQTKRRLGGGYAAALFITLGCCGFTSVPSCLHYVTAFLVMFAASLAVLCRYPFKRREDFGLLMMITGMVTSFADLLTVPIITLGIPLALYLALSAKNERPVGLGEMVGSCIAWGGGYAGCWVGKWAIGSLTVGWTRMLGSVGERSELWAGGMTIAGRMQAIGDNLRQMLFTQGIRTMVFPALLLLILLVLAVCNWNKAQIGTAGKLLLVAAMPIGWYFVMAEHSIVHSRFTFRTASVLMLGVYFALAVLVDWKQVHARFEAAKKKK